MTKPPNIQYPQTNQQCFFYRHEQLLQLHKTQDKLCIALIQASLRWTDCSGRKPQAQPLDVWSIWGDWDEVRTNLFGVFSCVGSSQSHADNMQSLRRLAVDCLSHWIFWLAVCQQYDHSDRRCASESAQCVGGAEYCVRFVFLCTLFRHSPFYVFE